MRVQRGTKARTASRVSEDPSRKQLDHQVWTATMGKWVSQAHRASMVPKGLQASLARRGCPAAKARLARGMAPWGKEVQKVTLDPLEGWAHQGSQAIEAREVSLVPLVWVDLLAWSGCWGGQGNLGHQGKSDCKAKRVHQGQKERGATPVRWGKREGTASVVTRAKLAILGCRDHQEPRASRENQVPGDHQE